MRKTGSITSNSDQLSFTALNDRLGQGKGKTALDYKQFIQYLTMRYQH